jgi:hypothetical protein
MKVKALGFNSNLTLLIATLSPVISALEFASDTSGFVYVWRASLPFDWPDKLNLPPTNHTTTLNNVAASDKA